jgi:hypothetical protein
MCSEAVWLVIHIELSISLDASSVLWPTRRAVIWRVVGIISYPELAMTRQNLTVSCEVRAS